MKWSTGKARALSTLLKPTVLPGCSTWITPTRHEKVSIYIYFFIYLYKVEEAISTYYANYIQLYSLFSLGCGSRLLQEYWLNGLTTFLPHMYRIGGHSSNIMCMYIYIYTCYCICYITICNIWLYKMWAHSFGKPPCRICTKIYIDL